MKKPDSTSALADPPTEPAPPSFVGSPQQQAIWDSLATDNQHTMVEALAGTGKTTTIVEGLSRLKPGQRAAFVAFNKSIASELQSRVPPGVQACTLHSLGFSALRRQFGSVEIDQDKVFGLVPESLGRWSRNVVARMVSLCKGRLIDGTDRDVLLDLAAEYDVDLGDNPLRILDEVPDALELSREATRTIDFDDMIWLPIVLGLLPQPFDVLMVDESQDLNPAQQELVIRSGRRVVLVGDRHQAIYGFRGADVQAMSTMQQRLEKSDRGLRVFPLTVTRRCPKLVVQLAQAIVPAFECPTDAADGQVCWGQDSEALPKRGEMVLCRTNAPIIELAYELIRAQVPVKIQGRDIGTGLATLIRRLMPDGGNTRDLLGKLEAYRQHETDRLAQLSPSRADARLQALHDKVQCIEALCEGIADVGDVLSRIQTLFSDVAKGDAGRFVLLSSVHRAKGLEAQTVRLIHPELLPHPMAKTDWAREQEQNLRYVALTRSRQALHVH